MKNSLREAALSKTKKNLIANLAIGLFCGLALILVAMLSLIDIYYVFFSMPIFLFPFLFASHISSFYLQLNQEISLTGFFNYFTGYFKSQFRGAFRAILSFGKSLIFYLLSLFAFYFLFYLIFQNYYGDLFINSFINFVSQYSISITNYEEIVNSLLANDNLLLTFFVYIEVSASIPFILSFIYFISFSSLSIYYRAGVLVGASSIISLCIANTFRSHRKQINKDWWSLNWPMLVLSLTGMISAAIIDLLIIQDISLLPSFVIVGSVALLMFFLPFYFSNMEVIYKKYENDFKKGNEDAIKSILERIQASIDFSAEEKKNIEESFRNEQNNDDKE